MRLSVTLSPWLGVMTASALVLSGCKTRTFGDKPTSAGIKQTAPTGSADAEAPYLHGGPFNFGIRFSKVTSSKAAEFWQSPLDPQSFTGSLTDGDFAEAFTKAPIVSDYFQEVLVNEQKQAVVLNAVRQYLKAVGAWASLHCIEIDVEKSQSQKTLVVNGPATIPGSEETACEFYSERRQAKTALGETTPSPKDTGKALAEGKGSLEISPDRKVTNDLAYGQGDSPHAEYFTIGSIRTRNVLSAQFSMNLKLADGTVLGGAGMNVAISGNYLVPMHSYQISKIYAVPVMEFDPKTGESKGFYDFGLLSIMKMPSEGNFLASVVSETDLPNWQNKNWSKIGNFANKASDKRGEVLPVSEISTFGFKPFWKTERLAVGAVHYVSNGRWVNVTKLTNQGVVHHDVSRDALLELYKGSDTGLGLVINTLDVVAEPAAAKSNPAAWHKVKSEEEACKLWLSEHSTLCGVVRPSPFRGPLRFSPQNRCFTSS